LGLFFKTPWAIFFFPNLFTIFSFGLNFPSLPSIRYCDGFSTAVFIFPSGFYNHVTRFLNNLAIFLDPLFLGWKWIIARFQVDSLDGCLLVVTPAFFFEDTCGAFFGFSWGLLWPRFSPLDEVSHVSRVGCYCLEKRSRFSFLSVRGSSRLYAWGVWGPWIWGSVSLSVVVWWCGP